MSTRVDAAPDFEEFVVVCSDRLLRTAYLLTGDAALAEDLLQTALAEAWFGWRRSDDPPEHQVRRILVTGYLTWWRRRWRGRTRHGDGTDLTVLPPAQRAVVVLRYFDGLAEADVAEVVGCSLGAVQRRTARAVGTLAVDDLAARLREDADDLGGSQPVGVHERATAVARRVAAARTRRRVGVVTVLAASGVLLVGGLLAVPRLLPEPPRDTVPPPDPMVQAPPRLAGHQMPHQIRVHGRTYRYERGEQTQMDSDLLRMAVASSPDPQILAWSTSPGTPGRVVVGVDGFRERVSAAGRMGYGLVLSADDFHLVTVRVTRPGPGVRIGLAVYQRDR